MRIAISVIFAIAFACASAASSPQAGATSGVPPPGSSVTPLPSPFREGIDLALTQSALENGQFADRFDFSRTRELWVRMRVAGMGGTTSVRLTLATPSGSVFYETTVAYSADPSRNEMTVTNDPIQNVMMVPNAPQPITVFRALPLRSGHALLYVVPVAGTALARYPVPGRWRLTATIDGAREISTELDVFYAP